MAFIGTAKIFLVLSMSFLYPMLSSILFLFIASTAFILINSGTLILYMMVLHSPSFTYKMFQPPQASQNLDYFHII